MTTTYGGTTGCLLLSDHLHQMAPRELRHSFVSLMSAEGVHLEDIARLVGYSSTNTTELVYRKELRPVIMEGADIMGKLFAE